MRNLYNLLPDYFKKIKDYQAIMSTEQVEIDSLENSVKQVLNNFYIMTCDESTLSQHEAILGITPSPTSTLTYRRQAVLSQWNSFAPYTKETLKEKLNGIIGSDGYELTINYNAQTIDILLIQTPLVTPEIITLIQSMLLTMLPAHLTYSVRMGTKINNEYTNYYDNGLVWATVYTNSYT